MSPLFCQTAGSRRDDGFPVRACRRISACAAHRPETQQSALLLRISRNNRTILRAGSTWKSSGRGSPFSAWTSPPVFRPCSFPTARRCWRWRIRPPGASWIRWASNCRGRARS
ncbi:hypothetical protein [Lysobacter gummosus]|uniref:hypothetical protein n=1 Tax=Lysobacter gummosus TaxID=262324 RepID=UPI003625950F